MQETSDEIRTSVRVLSDGKILVRFSREISYLEVTGNWADKMAQALRAAAQHAADNLARPSWKREVD